VGCRWCGCSLLLPAGVGLDKLESMGLGASNLLAGPTIAEDDGLLTAGRVKTEAHNCLKSPISF
jgi:hypothetical protein